jgi:hypothetical protein
MAIIHLNGIQSRRRESTLRLELGNFYHWIKDPGGRRPDEGGRIVRKLNQVRNYN